MSISHYQYTKQDHIWALDPPKCRYHPGEAHFGRLSSLCEHNLQSHQPYAVQAYQVCGPSAEENC
jgi:hypothetical protein